MTLDELADLTIKEMGAIHAQTADRTKVPVVLTLGVSDEAIEMTLPPNEPHPFWRINKRPLTPEESASLLAFRSAMASTRLQDVGDFVGQVRDGICMRVRAFIYNGRKMGWQISVEQVRVSLEAIPWTNLQ